MSLLGCQRCSLEVNAEGVAWELELNFYDVFNLSIRHLCFSVLQANSFTVSSVSAPSWLHRFIIGKKGQNLAKITQQMPKVWMSWLA